ncbi:MAG: GXWXG domain-containing protein [Geminicoccaceae bacterium]
MPAGEPDWLEAWRNRAIDPDVALYRFDTLPGLAPDAMLGHWRGCSLPTGHPLDGLLEALGWHGKAFDAADRVHPLLFRDSSGVPVAIEPARLPVGLALRLPGFSRSGPVRAAFRALRPLLRARGPAAKLETRVFRGRSSAAMVYDRLPITDHFRRIDADRVLGLMELQRSPRPFFFLLGRYRRVAASTISGKSAGSGPIGPK